MKRHTSKESDMSAVGGKSVSPSNHVRQLSHIQPDPRPPITQLDHQPRHHKRVMMLVTLFVVVILLSIALGYYLGTAAVKRTW